MDELSNCPFCGGEAHMEEQEAHAHSDALQALVPGIPDHPGSFTIECCGADCNTGQIADTKAEVIAMWNRRATSGVTSSEATPVPRATLDAIDAPWNYEWCKQLDISVCPSAIHAPVIVAAPPAALPQADERDAALFRQAIALEDNAEILYAAVLNNWPDADAIRREFDAAMPKEPS